jgi:hypothetical protein
MASVNPPENAQNQPETLLEFPCKFPIKAMGRDEQSLQALVTGIVLRHAELWPDQPVTTIPSSSGKYISITVTIEATSKPQLDRIYQDLTDCEQVLIAL